MIGTKTLISGLLLCAIYTETQAVDTIRPKVVQRKVSNRVIRGRMVFHFISIFIEAKPQPTVYGCPYLKVNNTVNDDVCLNKIKNGELQPIVVKNTTKENLRKYHEEILFYANDTYWYVYEQPASCWRTQNIYVSMDKQNYTKMDTWDPVKYAPMIRKAEFNETSLCVNMEVDALEDGQCNDFEYQIQIDRTLRLEADSCASCAERDYCCLDTTLIPSWTPVKFNGTFSKRILNFEHCMDSNFIRKPNTTYNFTSKYKEYGLFRIKSIELQLTPKVRVGDISGPRGNPFVIPLYVTATTSTTSGPTTISVSTTKASNGGVLGAGKIIIILSPLIILVQGCV